MFSYGFIQGDPHTVLSQQNTVVLSENIAKKYFGNDNPVGKNYNCFRERNMDCNRRIFIYAC